MVRGSEVLADVIAIDDALVGGGPLRVWDEFERDRITAHALKHHDRTPVPARFEGVAAGRSDMPRTPSELPSEFPDHVDSDAYSTPEFPNLPSGAERVRLV